MTDEEKKAIKDCDSIFICLDDAMSEDSANDYRKSYKILKNLIEKQSKEIEELKEKNKTLKSLQNDTNGLYIEMIERKNYFERELQKYFYQRRKNTSFATTITKEELEKRWKE